MKQMRQREEQEDFWSIFLKILVLYIAFLAFEFYVNRSGFWRYLLYGLVVFGAIVGGVWIWNDFKFRVHNKHLQRLFDEIHQTGLDEYTANFIDRFGLEKRSKNTWSFRDSNFKWDRLDDFRKFIREKGVEVSLDEWDDTLLILKHLIQAKEERLTRESIKATPQKFSTLSGKDFEKLLYRLFEKMGYSVQLTGKTGDQGGDLIANKNGERILIQAKRYENSVGNSAVQEAVAAQKFYNCTKAMVVTCSDFTAEAKSLAQANNVDLVGKKKLQELLLSSLGENWD